MKKLLLIACLLLFIVLVCSCTNITNPTSYTSVESNGYTSHSSIKDPITEPPSKEYITFYIDTYEELNWAFSEENPESEIQQNKSKYGDKFERFVNKIIENEVLLFPKIDGELLPLRNKEGSPNFIIWESEAFDLPWIWIFGRYENKTVRVMTTLVENVEDPHKLNGLEILEQIVPNVNWQNQENYTCTVQDIQLKNETVKAVAFENITDSELGQIVYFYCNGFFVRIITEYEISDVNFWSSLEFVKN